MYLALSITAFIFFAIYGVYLFAIYVFNWPIQVLVTESIYLFVTRLSSSTNKKISTFPILDMFSVIVCLCG